MARKSGGVKRLFLALVLIALLIVVFILLGGGDLLKSTGSWIGNMGTKAEHVKHKIEKKASTIEKTVKKLKEEEKTGEKK